MTQNKKLPVAIILPHASLAVPPELEGKVALTPEQIFNEADAYTDLIFDYRDKAARWLYFPYARAVVDVNRPIDPDLNRPGDGIVKRQTSYGAPVYKPGCEPEPLLESQLIAHYWQPWHHELESLAADRQVKLVIDCHSMAAIGPKTYGDPDQLRPRISVANLGDENGEMHPLRQRLSAPPVLAQHFADLLAPRFAAMEPLAPVGDVVSLNVPYFGGWNLWAHSGAVQPWLMVELNRGMYVGAQDGDTAVVPPDHTRIAAIRDAFWEAVTLLVELLPH